MPKPATSRATNVVLVVDAGKRVGGALAAEGAGAVRGAGRRAERPRAMRRIHGEVVGQAGEPAQRAEHLVRQRLGEIRSAQVGAPDRADHQRAAGEQRRSGGRRVRAGRRDGRACDPVSPDATSATPAAEPTRSLVVDDRPMRRCRDATPPGRRTWRRCAPRAPGCRSRSRHGSACRWSSAIRSPSRSASASCCGREAGRVDERGGAVAEVDQVRRVAEALVDERADPHHTDSSTTRLLKQCLEYWSVEGLGCQVESLRKVE